MNLSTALTDPELGYTSFTLQRTTYAYNAQQGKDVPTVQEILASGIIHPGSTDKIQLLPEEDRHEEFIEVYAEFPISLGENNLGAPNVTGYSVPDRVVWNSKTWRFVRVTDWMHLGYMHGLAVLVQDIDFPNERSR